MTAVKRILLTLGGGLLLVLGTVLLVLPGPGLILIVAGLTLLSMADYAWANRWLAPVRRRAHAAARDSVTSPVKLAASVVVGLGLVGFGVAWIIVDALPFSGAASGGSLVFSGVVLLGLLGYSYTVERP